MSKRLYKPGPGVGGLLGRARSATLVSRGEHNNQALSFQSIYHGVGGVGNAESEVSLINHLEDNTDGFLDDRWLMGQNGQAISTYATSHALMNKTSATQWRYLSNSNGYGSAYWQWGVPLVAGAQYLWQGEVQWFSTGPGSNSAHEIHLVFTAYNVLEVSEHIVVMRVNEDYQVWLPFIVPFTATGGTPDVSKDAIGFYMNSKNSVYNKRYEFRNLSVVGP